MPLKQTPCLVLCIVISFFIMYVKPRSSNGVSDTQICYTLASRLNCSLVSGGESGNEAN